MEKIIECTKCHARIRIFGPVDRSKEVSHGVTCPNCKEPNEVVWPMNCGWKVEVSK